MERYRDMYFEDCVELLKNKHSYRKHVDKFIDYSRRNHERGNDDYIT